MRAAVTGIGLVTGLGLGAPAFMNGLLERAQPRRSTRAGASVIAPDERELAGALAGERRRSLNAETAMLLVAARLALRDAQLDLPAMDLDRLGIAVSTRHAGLQDYAELLGEGRRDDRGQVNPARGPLTGLNAPAALLSIRLGAAGPNVTISNGAVGGIDALGCALDALAAGHADAMLVCGVDAVPPVVAQAQDPAPPAGEPGPSTGARRGPVLGSAAAVLVLEPEASDGRARATVDAAATAFSPGGDLASASGRVLREALELAGCAPVSVAACFAAANGSPAGDAAEARALSCLLAPGTPVCAIKGAIGECLGASAVVQLAAAALSIERGVVPPSPGVRALELAPLPVTTAAQPLRRGAVAVHAWDEGAVAGAAVLRRPDAGEA